MAEPKLPLLVRASRWLAWKRYVWFSRRLGRGHPTSAEQWDLQYEAGHWDRLGDPEEIGHYALIIGYCNHAVSTRRLLDVGCGTGLLRQRMGPWAGTYTGLDIAASAIAQARIGCAHERAEFRVGGIDALAPSELFDVIVFNEVLYYFDDPRGMVLDYARHLESGGMVVVSMVSPSGDCIWPNLFERLSIRFDNRVTNRLGVTWRVVAFGQPQTAAVS